jgi:modulator of FtsH protease
MGYQVRSWSDLFIATAGAAASLTGLLFVAISINLRQIIEMKTLTSRAAETLSILLVLLLEALFCLIPGESRQQLGVELLVLGIASLAGILPHRLRLERAADQPWLWTVSPVAVAALALVPIVVCGISLIAGAGGGLYWAFASVVCGLVGTLSNAWVLLVEILR